MLNFRYFLLVLIVHIAYISILPISKSIAQAPGLNMSSENVPVSISRILFDANCPITHKQSILYSTIEPGDGFDKTMSKLDALFTDTQIQALRTKLGTIRDHQGRITIGDFRLAYIRNLFIVFIFEKEQVHLTERQLKNLNKASVNKSFLKQLKDDTFTPAQHVVIQKYYKKNSNIDRHSR